jgi:hypothetical protein
MWQPTSGGTNSTTYFRASEFKLPMKRMPTPIPETTTYFKSKLAHHMALSDEFKSFSPFISATDSLVWLVFKAIDQVNQGAEPKEVHITTIDGKESSKSSDCRYAAPIYKEIKKMEGLVPDNHRKYKASSEWIYWYEISSGIRGTCTVADIYSLCKESRAAAEVFRLDAFKKARSTLGARLNIIDTPVYLDDTTHTGFAKILLLFDIKPTMDPDIIEAGVHAIVQGWNVLFRSKDDLEEAFGVWVFYTFKNTQASQPFDIDISLAAFVAGAQNATKSYFSKRKSHWKGKGKQLMRADNLEDSPQTVEKGTLETVLEDENEYIVVT